MLDQRPARLVFDLAMLEFLDSSGIAVMLRAAAVIPSVVIVNPSDLITQILSATGLTDTFHVES